MSSIYLIQLGLGGVGRALTQQILAQRAQLQARYGFQLEYVAIADQSGVVSAPDVLSVEQIQAALAAKAQGQSLAASAGAQPGDWTELLAHRRCIIVDTTAADGNEQALVKAVANGHRVVLANKRPLSADWQSFLALTGTGATRYETTVGAGLPVIAPLQGLLDSGDSLISIEASMSGTLGYLCSELESGQPLSQIVRTAHRIGYTEPDPRDDLSGADVARKALILARTCGLPWSFDQIPAEPWFPAELATVSRDAFMASLEDLDETFAKRIANARAERTALRYVATITPEGASVGLRDLPLDHPLAGLRGPDNLFSITTARYSERPLVIRGPGAGQDITAAGVFTDIIATAREQ